LDIYQHWCASKIYHIDITPNLSTLICIQIYQLDMSWIFINIDVPPKSITLIELQIYRHWYVYKSINLICLGYYQHRYVLDIYQHWYNSNFYQHWYNSNLFLRIRFRYYYLSTSIDWILISIDIYLDVYQHR
jgi:hypothetical protein